MKYKLFDSVYVVSGNYNYFIDGRKGYILGMSDRSTNSTPIYKVQFTQNNNDLILTQEFELHEEDLR